MTATMDCWKVLLPANFEHPSLTMDLLPLMNYYQQHYCGAAYSSCGGGYLYVVSEQPVPGAFHPVIRGEHSRMTEVFVRGPFHDLRSRDVRFLQEATRLGNLTVGLWSDESFRRLVGRPPEFPQAERMYMLEAIRYIDRVVLVDEPVDLMTFPAHWASARSLGGQRSRGHPGKTCQFCASAGIGYRAIPDFRLEGFPPSDYLLPDPGRKKVIVTGCFDWLHSGHIRFFEQAAGFGDLYVSIGSDGTIRQLKGAGHPLQSQAGAALYGPGHPAFSDAFIASGSGYLDVEPDIERIKPDIYLVNADGDRPENANFVVRTACNIWCCNACRRKACLPAKALN